MQRRKPLQNVKNALRGGAIAGIAYDKCLLK